MRNLIMKPSGWQCKFSECPPGYFVNDGQLCFKSEYFRDGGLPEAYNSAGEAYHGDLDELVQPVTPEWVDEEL